MQTDMLTNQEYWLSLILGSFLIRHSSQVLKLVMNARSICRNRIGGICNDG